jgi:ribosomal protein S18 acetylase RimI-like enzyme
MTVLRPMVQAEYVAWLEEAVPAYAEDKVASGQWSQEEALELSRKEYVELLPRGLETPDNYLYAITDSESNAVGMLWFAVKTKFNSRVAYVFDIHIARERRREGHAFGAFLALEAEIEKLGLSGIALHVFGHNTGAQALYAKLGFQPTNISLFKSVGPPGA